MLALASRALGPWLPLAAFLAGLAVVTGIYTAGYRSAAASSQAATYKQERDAARRDLEIVQSAALAAEQMAAEAKLRSTELQKKVDDYVGTLKPDNSCRLTRNDVERLRGIK